MSGLLYRDEDRPARNEEEAIARLDRHERDRARRADDIRFALELSAARSRRAKARGAVADNDLAIERAVQNRRLDERNALLGVPRDPDDKAPGE